MCGFAGVIGRTSIGSDDMVSLLARMGADLAHRGPDDSGVLWDPVAAVGLVHRRLAIVDLSPHGRQPMTSQCGRFSIVYNGEVYNFQSIRKQLEKEGIRWNGHSDTEVILNAIAHWGLREALEKFIGMFAFGLWDRERREFYLARDRLGIKPLYYTVGGTNCIFASELTPIRRFPDFEDTVDRTALASFVDLGYVPTPNSIYKNVRKLAPGQLVRISLRSGRIEIDEPQSYWSLGGYLADLSDSPAPDESEVVQKLESLIRDSISLRMIADVPIGTFLSGGIDSTLVTAIMQQLSGDPIRTFTIGFDEKGYNEAEFSKAIASHLGTQHTEVYVNERDLLEIVPTLSEVFDEPFADSSQLPTLMLSRITRESVTVALSGDGGDESLAGYSRHTYGNRLSAIRANTPAGVRKIVGRSIRAVPTSGWDAVYALATRMWPRANGIALAGDKAHKFARALAAPDTTSLYRSIVSQNECVNLIGDVSGNVPEPWWENQFKRQTAAEDLMYLDTVMYLPDDVLTKVDRCTMSVGLEARVPLLDHRIVEYLWSLPIGMKIRNGTGKFVLRQLLARLLPEELWNRPKMGFSVPVSKWLKGPLQSWADDMLAPTTIKNDGFLNADDVSKLWSQHRSGSVDSPYLLWNILMFQQWLHGLHD